MEVNLVGFIGNIGISTFQIMEPRRKFEQEYILKQRKRRRQYIAESYIENPIANSWLSKFIV